MLYTETFLNVILLADFVKALYNEIIIWKEINNYILDKIYMIFQKCIIIFNKKKDLWSLL